MFSRDFLPIYIYKFLGERQITTTMSKRGMKVRKFKIVSIGPENELKLKISQ